MIILDTSFLYSFLNKNDANHNKAVELMNKIISRKFGKPIIFEYVIDELFTLMINKQPFSYIEKVIDLILIIIITTIIPNEIIYEERKIFKYVFYIFYHGL